MNNREKLQTIAFRVHDLLSIYIKLHDRILKKQGSIRSLFRKVPFEQLYRETADMFVAWTMMHSEVGNLRQETYEELSDAEKEYLDCLSLYVVAVTKAVKVLLSNQYDLYEASKSFKNSTLTLEKTVENSKLYERAMVDYQKIGEKLTDLNATIFG